MDFELLVHVNWKTHKLIVSQHGKLPSGYEQYHIAVTLDDLVTPGTAGFVALHEKLGILAATHKFNVDKLIEGIAVTSVIRRIFLTKGCGIAPYVAQHILDLLRESHACSGYGSLRKTASYTDFLLHHVGHQERTIPSINSRKTDNKYVLPDDVDDMTVEMLMEELRFAEEKAAKPALLEKLRGLLRGQQAVDREKSRKGKPQSDMDLIKSVMEPEYDDVPTKKKGKKA